MALVPGTRLGAYEILSSLGTGGMGEVFRARDTRLGRDVAIKTLPAGLSQDPDRRARFETETRAVAALSHPNVLAIHDIGEQAGVVYAVMELVEGETLRERLMDGALSAARALPLAIQIAHGLAAAHDRGILHRDLKPENLIVTPEGRAKILDFGLAKRTEESPESSQSLAPTLAAGTQAGVVLGTTGYMSPEQVRGEVVDARSDLFALGAVLYEMLAGRRAFQAASAAETMTAILREEPPDFAQLGLEASPALERIVRRCLEKQPAARFRSAADLAFALESISASGSSGSQSSVPHAGGQPGGRLRFQRLTYRNGHVAGARFTPDGAAVVYGAAWDGGEFEIFTSRPGNPESRHLGLPPGSVLAMSPSGVMAISVGYKSRFWFQASGTLARVSLSGGGIRPLQKDVQFADWDPEEKTMAVIRLHEGRTRLEYPAGTSLVDSPEGLGYCTISPDGRHVAFSRHPFPGDTAGEVCVADSSGNIRVICSGMATIGGIRWHPSGEEFWFSGINAESERGIWGSKLNGTLREVYQSPVRIVLHDIAADGRVLVSLGDLRLAASFGRWNESSETNLAWFDGSFLAGFSPEGSQALLGEVGEAENPHYAAYLKPLDGSAAIRLGDGMATDFSPDGNWVIARRLGSGKLALYPTGFGEQREISFEGLDRVLWVGFHPDDRHLFLCGSLGDSTVRLYSLPVEGGIPRPLWDEGLYLEWSEGPPISPDGSRIVLRRVTGEYVELTIATGEARGLTFAPGEAPLRYDATGGELFVAGGERNRREIHRLNLATGARVPWQTMKMPDPTGVVYCSNPLISADGTLYGYSYARMLFSLCVVEGLQ